MKPPLLIRMILLMLLICSGFISCKGAPAAIEDDSGEEEFSSYDDTDLGGWTLDDLGGEGDYSDEPSLSLPPAFPPGDGPPDLPEPDLEYGEAFLPGIPPEEAALAWVLPEPAIPGAPAEPPEAALAEDGPPSPEPALAEDEPASSEPTVPSAPPGPPPPPSRLVRPSEPIPPPPPVRAPIPMPANPIPASPAQPPVSAVPSRPAVPAPSSRPAPLPPGPSSLPPSATPFTPAPAPGLPTLGEASSRIVRATAGQTVEIPFRGTGWVYLGEATSQRGVSYISRRLDSEGQTFILRADEPGTYELKFYRQDFIRDYIINDMVKLIVEEAPIAAIPFGAPVDRTRVIAEPRWPAIPGAQPETAGSSGAGTQPVPANPGASGTVAPSASAGQVPQPNRGGAGTSPAAPASRGATEPGRSAGSAPGVAGANAAGPTGVVGTGTAGPVGTGSAGAEAGGIEGRGAPGAAGGSSALPETGLADSGRLLPGDAPPEEYLRQARAEYDAGRVPQALDVLDQFRTRFPLGSDEAWWLYGQYYEAAGPSRNIRSSLEYYRRLVNEYPQSPWYTEARRKIAYLERYYINIQ